MTTPEVLINDSQTDQTNISSKARQMSPTGFSNHTPGEYSTAQKTDPCKMHRPHRSPYPHSHVPSHPGVERGHVRRPSAHKISPHENNPGQISRHSGSAVPPSDSGGFAGSQAHQPPPGMARGLREHHSRDMQQYPGFVPIARRSRARHVTGSAMNLSSSRSRESVMTGGGMRRPSSDSYGSREFSNDDEANKTFKTAFEKVLAGNKNLSATTFQNTFELRNTVYYYVLFAYYRQSYKSNSSRQYEASPRNAHYHKPGQNMSRRRSQDFSEDYVRHTSAGGGGRRMNEDRIRRRPSHSRPHSGPDPSSYLPGSASTMPPMSAGQGYGPKKLSPTHHYAGNYPPQSSRGHRSRGRSGRMGRGMPQATSTPPT
uniref:Uncharacterized protein n=2 Tax=Helobdella robusta TaxID=6412 RepID=T1FLG1_HELRO